MRVVTYVFQSISGIICVEHGNPLDNGRGGRTHLTHSHHSLTHLTHSLPVPHSLPHLTSPHLASPRLASLHSHTTHSLTTHSLTTHSLTTHSLTAHSPTLTLPLSLSDTHFPTLTLTLAFSLSPLTPTLSLSLTLIFLTAITSLDPNASIYFSGRSASTPLDLTCTVWCLLPGYSYEMMCACYKCVG